MGSRGPRRRKEQRPLPKVRTRLSPVGWFGVSWTETPIRAGPFTRTQRRQWAYIRITFTVFVVVFIVALGLYTVLG